MNWVLAIGVIALVLIFQNSNSLANAYGVAVTGTFILNTVLFLAVARALWHTPKWRLAGLGVLFLSFSYFLDGWQLGAGFGDPLPGTVGAWARA